MNQSSLSKKLPPVLQILYRPMLFISLALHGIFLTLPMPQPTKSQVEQKPQNEELEITQLLAPPKKPSPQSSLQTTRPQRQLPQPNPKITPSISQPKPTPSISPTPQATLSPTPTPLASPTPLPSPEVSPTLEPTSEPTIEASPNVSDDNVAEFQNLFGEVAGEVAEDLGVDPSYFAQPELFFTPESLATEEPQQKQEIARIKWISLKTPEQVFTEIEPQLQSSGMEVSIQGEYGGGNVYKIQKGNFITYLNLVHTATSIGTMIVVWNSDPLQI
ncbi:hypothetical protein [Gloeocapsopsis sp. IPPAS B-1203]|uniref:hypothetical protein n=1 Tax=Gloeocapsopsis sp. IPPAS B-1203 TaxID=2049454 RepID=UPI000C1A021B|nr:hypothetical protein [Gloeocapsopsis sp. IPPAS B-1203]PIG94627.1 hypothetical protein CSQ79_04945 [Gloeocapsopsis sp. IPPAS B-1203]